MQWTFKSFSEVNYFCKKYDSMDSVKLIIYIFREKFYYKNRTRLTLSLHMHFRNADFNSLTLSTECTRSEFDISSKKQIKTKEEKLREKQKFSFQKSVSNILQRHSFVIPQKQRLFLRFPTKFCSLFLTYSFVIEKFLRLKKKSM